MPELPEVETIKNDLTKVLIGKRISGFSCRKPGLLRSPLRLFKAKLVSARIISVKRRAKLIIIGLSTGYHLVIHLKMTGQLVWRSSAGQVRSGGHPIGSVSKVPNKYTYITVDLSGGAKLYFNDVRQFGYWQLVNKFDIAKLLSQYGPEPLADHFSFEEFSDNLLRHSKTNIKAALLNQKVVAGLGNIYVDESLFVAKIRPSRKVGGLKMKELVALQAAVVKVLKRAVAARGTSFNTYRDALGRSGSYWQQRFVYGRDGDNCLVCGRAIKKITLAGRGTHYCAFCQR